MDKRIDEAMRNYELTKDWWIRKYKLGEVSTERVYTRMSAYLESMVDNGLCWGDDKDKKLRELVTELRSSEKENKREKAMQKYKRAEEKCMAALENGSMHSRNFYMKMVGHMDSLVNRNIMTREERAAEFIRIQEMLYEREWNKLKKLDGK